MKKTAKLVMMSVLTIAMCVSLIAGATFALFSDGDSVNIVVQSGKVEVIASIGEEITTYSYRLNKEGAYEQQLTETQGTFEIGGTAKLTNDGIELTNIVPGDKAEFQIIITNNSDVTVKYQTYVSLATADSDAGLLNALKISLDEEALEASSAAKYSKWDDLADGETAIDVVIELPYDYDDDSSDANSIQGKDCAITFAVTAVQGNAQTFDSAEEFMDSASKGGNISMMNDADVSGSVNGVLLEEGVELTINGNDKAISGNRTAFYYNHSEAGTITFKNVHFKGTGINYGYAFMLGTNSQAEVIFENCTFENLYTAVYINKNAVENAATITFTGCKFIDTTWCYSIDSADIDVIFGEDNTCEGWHVGEQEVFNASYFVKAGADAAANGKKLQDAINNAQEGETIYVSAGTYEATANDQYRLITDNISIVGAGEGKTIIDTKGYSCSGQAAILVSGHNCTIANLTVKSGSTDGNVAAIKVTNVGTTQELPVVEGFNLKNVTIEGTAGHGLNLHGVEGATIDGLTVASYGKCAIALARATDVVIENATTAKMGWSDIGFMYGSGSAFATASSATVIFDTCAFGNGFIYSERTDNGIDVINHGNSGWQRNELGEGAWSLVRG